MFSAGHVRTPRQEIKEWYEQKFPNHLDTKRFVDYMSKWMTEYLDQIGDIPLLIPNSMVEDGIKDQIQTMGGAALEGASIGDIIGGTLHDLDNEGLAVISDVDPQGKEVSGGYKWQAMGDDFLAYSQETFNMTAAAVKASLADLATAKDAGHQASRGQSVPPDQLEKPAQQTLKMLEPFVAKRFIPREDTSRSSPIPDWKWESLAPFLVEQISVWLKKNIVQTLRDMAAGLYPPDGIKRVEVGGPIPMGQPGVGYPPPPSGQPANIPSVTPYVGPSSYGIPNIPTINIMNLHVRDALKAFSEHVNQHGFDVLKNAINQVSPVADVTNSPSSGDAGVPDATVTK